MFTAVTKPAILSVTTSPGPLKNNVKKEDAGGKVEDNGLTSDQLVPDYAAGLVIGLMCQTTPPVCLLFLLCVGFRHDIFCLFCSVLFGRQEETKNVPDGRPQTLSLPSDNCE